MVVGASRTYYQKWRFRVVVDGFPGDAYFQKAGPLEAEVAVAEYKGGGAFFAHKEAASGSFAALTLERGSTEDQYLYEWFKNVMNAAANSGENQDGYKRNISLMQLDRTGEPVKVYTIYDAFPTKYSAGDWDGTADEFSMESLELQYNYFEQETVPTI